MTHYMYNKVNPESLESKQSTAKGLKVEINLDSIHYNASTSVDSLCTHEPVLCLSLSFSSSDSCLTCVICALAACRSSPAAGLGRRNIDAAEMNKNTDPPIIALS
mmetsp:Transcript_30567/g.37805  ORF Transcript_30567/g.37805 Transcript_30567/m.37805 type:complete len:105 (-) Transcript_30567:201-515(-)